MEPLSVLPPVDLEVTSLLGRPLSTPPVQCPTLTTVDRCMLLLVPLWGMDTSPCQQSQTLTTSLLLCRQCITDRRVGPRRQIETLPNTANLLYMATLLDHTATPGLQILVCPSDASSSFGRLLLLLLLPASSASGLHVVSISGRGFDPCSFRFFCAVLEPCSSDYIDRPTTCHFEGWNAFRLSSASPRNCLPTTSMKDYLPDFTHAESHLVSSASNTSSGLQTVKFLIKLQAYDGTGSLETFLAKFQSIASYHCWTDKNCYHHLCASLEEAAGEVLLDTRSQATTGDIVQLLQTRFGTELLLWFLGKPSNLSACPTSSVFPDTTSRQTDLVISAHA